MGQSERRFDPRQRGVDCNLTRDLFRHHIALRAEVAVQAVRLPAEAAEFGVGFRILIAEIGVGCLDLLRYDVGEIRGLLRILLRVGEREADLIGHPVHGEPTNGSCSNHQQDEKREADRQNLANRLEPEKVDWRDVHLASATVSAPS